MKTITAIIPARTEKSRQTGKVFVYPARTENFEIDADGQWWGYPLTPTSRQQMQEADVIDVCRRASNWAEIKAAHFQMQGFSS